MKRHEFSCQVIRERLTIDRSYKLVSVTLPAVGKTERRRVIETLLNNPTAIGIIEWWNQGSIVKKPWRDFQVIIISVRHGLKDPDRLSK